MIAIDAEQDPAQRKKSVRAEILARRDALPLEQRRQGSSAIARTLLSHAGVRAARAVLAYASIDSEVQTDQLLAGLMSGTRRIILPRVNRALRRLDLYYVTDIEQDLLPGTWGIREPDPARCEPVTDTRAIDVVIVPGVAFTVQGHRLGYGGGFYDKLLGAWQGSRCFVAPAFEEQIVPSLLLDPHDIRMDAVVTPGGTFTCLSET